VFYSAYDTTRFSALHGVVRYASDVLFDLTRASYEIDVWREKKEEREREREREKEVNKKERTVDS